MAYPGSRLSTIVVSIYIWFEWDALLNISLTDAFLNSFGHAAYSHHTKIQ